MSRTLPSKIEVQFGPGVTGNFLLIPAGAFFVEAHRVGKQGIGSLRRHVVGISRPYYLQETPVTQQQFEVLTGAIGDVTLLAGFPGGDRKSLIYAQAKAQSSAPSLEGSAPFNVEGPDYPVCEISWQGAFNFCQTLSDRFPRVFRLPTSMEWQWAAQGGDGDRYIWAGSNYPEEVCWHEGNSNGKIQPVKQKKPNSYGLYDMSGNVGEFCFDWWSSGEYPDDLIDFTGINLFERQRDEYFYKKVVRGGSCVYPERYAKINDVGWESPNGVVYKALGFRLLMEIP